MKNNKNADLGRNDDGKKEPIKRLTVDIPISLHNKIKADCASRGLKISDVLRDMLFERWGDKTDQG